MSISFDDPTPDEIRAAMQAGESETVEFKVGPISGLALSQLGSAFANAKGGAILIGVRENPTSVVGCSFTAVTQVFDSAISRLRPVPEMRLHRVTLDSKDVGAILVKPHPQIVLSDAGAFIRKADKTIAMTPAEIVSRLPDVAQHQDRDAMAEGIAHITDMVSELQRELGYYRSWRNQWKGALIGFVVGFFGSLLANYVTGMGSPK